MTTTARTPYRTSSTRTNERVSWMSRRVRRTLVTVVAISSAVAVVVALVWYVTSVLGVRRAMRRTFTLDEAHHLHRTATAWRSAHPLACPTLVDLGVPPTHADAWNSGYGIECTPTTTTIRSAGPDRVYFTSDDILWR